MTGDSDASLRLNTKEDEKVIRNQIQNMDRKEYHQRAQRRALAGQNWAITRGNGKKYKRRKAGRVC